MTWSGPYSLSDYSVEPGDRMLASQYNAVLDVLKEYWSGLDPVVWGAPFNIDWDARRLTPGDPILASQIGFLKQNAFWWIAEGKENVCKALGHYWTKIPGRARAPENTRNYTHTYRSHPDGSGAFTCTITLDGETDSATINYQETGVGIVFAKQPENMTVELGGEAVFTVVVFAHGSTGIPGSDPGPVNLQWQYNDGTWKNVSGATSPVLRVTITDANKTFQWRAVASASGVSTAYSNAAGVAIGTPDPPRPRLAGRSIGTEYWYPGSMFCCEDPSEWWWEEQWICDEWGCYPIYVDVWHEGTDAKCVIMEWNATGSNAGEISWDLGQEPNTIYGDIGTGDTVYAEHFNEPLEVMAVPRQASFIPRIQITTHGKWCAYTHRYNTSAPAWDGEPDAFEWIYQDVQATGIPYPTLLSYYFGNWGVPYAGGCRWKGETRETAYDVYEGIHCGTSGDHALHFPDQDGLGLRLWPSPEADRYQFAIDRHQQAPPATFYVRNSNTSAVGQTIGNNRITEFSVGPFSWSGPSNSSGTYDQFALWAQLLGGEITGSITFTHPTGTEVRDAIGINKWTTGTPPNIVHRWDDMGITHRPLSGQSVDLDIRTETGYPIDPLFE